MIGKARQGTEKAGKERIGKEKQGKAMDMCMHHPLQSPLLREVLS
jgi:hypothetical protein